MRDRRTAILAFLLVAVAAMSQAADIFLSALDEAAARAEAAARRPLVELARADVNAFAEYAWTDAEGRELKQARHHLVFQDLVSSHDRLVMWFPVEHGKSTQARILATWLLGNYPDRQYAIVKAKAKPAQRDVKAVARAIVANKRLRDVFPDLRPAVGELRSGADTWGAEGIRVHGSPPGLPDPSLAAYGLDGQILGARLHGVIIDNVLDKSNTQSPDQRRKVLETIDEEILSRILPGGFCVIIDTAWHVDDALHEIAKRPRWHSARFDAEDGIEEGETLWQDRFPAERLADIRGTMSAVAYNRMYRNMPLSETTAYFREDAWLRARGASEWLDAWPQARTLQVEMVTGVDLATRKKETADETAMVTATRDGDRRIMHNITAGRMEGPDVLRAMVRVYKDFHAPVQRAGGTARFVVEDNAAQVYIVQMLRDRKISRGLDLDDDEAAAIQVVGRTTTAKVRDAELGIQSLATDLEMDRWAIPAHPETTNLREEMRVWTPDAHTGDRLMAMWIAASAFGSSRLEMGRGAGQLDSLGGGVS